VRTGLILAVLAAASGPAVARAQSPQSPAPAPPGSRTAPPPGGTVREVVVTGQTPPVTTSIDRRSYSVASDLRAQTGSISDALRNVPSVEVDVQGNVSLRGDPNVTILIDGKPSGQFQGDAKGQALQQLPADRIERVEVITNPSAEFRADGTAGIINLVTKKAKGTGLTGGLRANIGSEDRYNMGGNVGYNSKQLSLSGDAFYRHDPLKQTFVEDRGRLDPTTGTLDATHQDQIGRLSLDIAGARGSVDYDLSPQTRLSAELRGNYTDFGLDLFTHTERKSGAGLLTNVFDRTVNIDQSRANEELTLGLTRKFGEGHDLKLNLSYELTDDNRTRDGATSLVFPTAPDAFTRQGIDNRLRQLDFKGDYQRAMEGGAKLKAGFDIQRDDNRYANTGFRGPSAPATLPDPTLTNRFLYEQLLSQAYVTYEKPIGDVTILAGLRAEDTRLDLTQATLGQKAENDYLRVYPSLHLGWKLSDTQQLSASYSHRVQRPQPEDYNSFRFFLDPITFRAGNTALRPQDTNSFELGYQYRKAPTFYLATLYYRENLHGITDVTRDIGGGVFLITRENVSKTRNGGLELVASGQIAKGLTYNLSGNAFWSELDATGLGFADKRSTVTAFGRATLNWQVTPKDLVQLGGFLNGKRLTPQGSVAPTGMLNIGYRHKLNDRLSLLISAQDVLGTFRDRIVIDTPALKDTIRRGVNTELVYVGLSWTFGGGRQRDPGFDFQNGAGAAPPQ